MTRAQREAKRRRRWRVAERRMRANVYHGYVYVDRCRIGAPGPAWRDVMRWIREGRVEAFVSKIDLIFGTGARALDVYMPNDLRASWARSQYRKACTCKACRRGGRNMV